MISVLVMDWKGWISRICDEFVWLQFQDNYCLLMEHSEKSTLIYPSKFCISFSLVLVFFVPRGFHTVLLLPSYLKGLWNPCVTLQNIFYKISNCFSNIINTGFKIYSLCTSFDLYNQRCFRPNSVVGNNLVGFLSFLE